jgi:hypothetical protein
MNHQYNSPNGRFSLEISGPIDDTSYFMATFRCVDGSAGVGELGAAFGFAEPSGQEPIVRWDLPDNVCGLYLDGKCWGLFRFGAGRRRHRGSFRASGQDAFNTEEIADFCAVKRAQSNTGA